MPKSTNTANPPRPRNSLILQWVPWWSRFGLRHAELHERPTPTSVYPLTDLPPRADEQPMTSPNFRPSHARPAESDSAVPTRLSPEGHTMVARVGGGADQSTNGSSIKPLESKKGIPARRADEPHDRAMTPPRSRHLLCMSFLCALCAGATLSTSAFSQPATAPTDTRAQPARLSTTPASVESLLSAAYLSPDQLKDARIRFGRYSPDDLDTPARVARAALIRGVLSDPALAISDTDADPLDRAEAAALRGEFPAARTLLDALPTQTPRAVRVRAAILEDEGKFDDAITAGASVLKDLAANSYTQPDDIIEAVTLAAMKLRLRGPATAKSGATTSAAELLRGDGGPSPMPDRRGRQPSRL